MRHGVFSQLLVLLLLSAGLSRAATLDVPRPGDHLSGIGVIHGWKCTAGQLTVRFNGGPALPLLYGVQRQDVLRASACRHQNPDVGFVSTMNWNELGDGTHTAVAYDDGVEFARSRFTVVTLGRRPPPEDGACIAEDFPLSGDQSRFLWNQGTQRMELVEVREWRGEPTVSGEPANTDLDFLLTEKGGTWTIEVPDLLAWQVISQYENPEWSDDGWGGNRYVAGPAEVEFLRYVHGGTSNRLYPFSAIPPWGISLVGHIQGTRVAGTDRQGNAILKKALSNLIEIGTLANGLPQRTREAIGETAPGYSIVVPRSSADTTQGNRCYILVFDDFRFTPAGGLEAQARFYITARSPYVRDEPRLCLPPVYRGGVNGQAVPHVTGPHDTTRLMIY